MVCFALVTASLFMGRAAHYRLTELADYIIFCQSTEWVN